MARGHYFANVNYSQMFCIQFRFLSAIYVGEDEGQVLNPARGTRVDSISYYTRDLANANKILLELQKRMEKVAESGNAQGNALLDKLLRYANDTADQIMEDSLEDNELTSPSDSYTNLEGLSSQAPYVNFKEERSGAQPARYEYGSFTQVAGPAAAPPLHQITKQILSPSSLQKSNGDIQTPSALTPLGSCADGARNMFARRRHEPSIPKTVTWSTSAESDDRSVPLVEEEARLPVSHHNPFALFLFGVCRHFPISPSKSMSSKRFAALPACPSRVVAEVYRTWWWP